ncbi:hypothetical protein KC867_03455 [Candidatus Saccharibacteria bacterium]|nr:hypothetical protein [Candidatus Saccharibacteria bacterium]
MSEKLNKNHESSRERSEKYESLKTTSERQEKLKNKIEKEARNAKHEHDDNIEKIRSSIDKHAEQKDAHQSKLESEKTEDEQPILVNKELKSMSYRRTIKRTQSKLNPASRSFSKIVHQPAVEKISEVADKTVARPSGILAGGILSFLGSALFLWMSKYYGYSRYNFLLFFIFFVGGFFLGLIIELIIYAFRRNRK